MNSGKRIFSINIKGNRLAFGFKARKKLIHNTNRMPVFSQIRFNNQTPSIFSRLGLPQDPKGEGNRLQPTSKQLQTNFQNVQETSFLAPKIVKMTLSEGQILTQNFEFRDHISTFRAENTPKSKAFKAKNND